MKSSILLANVSPRFDIAHGTALAKVNFRNFFRKCVFIRKKEREKREGEKSSIYEWETASSCYSSTADFVLEEFGAEVYKGKVGVKG